MYLSKIYIAGKAINEMMKDFIEFEKVNPSYHKLSTTKQRLHDLSNGILAALEVDQENRILQEQNEILKARFETMQNEWLEMAKELKKINQIESL